MAGEVSEQEGGRARAQGRGPPCCSLRHPVLHPAPHSEESAPALGPPLSSPRLSQVWFSCFMQSRFTETRLSHPDFPVTTGVSSPTAPGKAGLGWAGPLRPPQPCLLVPTPWAGSGPKAGGQIGFSMLCFVLLGFGQH